MMDLNTIINNQLECVSGIRELSFEKVSEDKQQDWCVCARDIRVQKNHILASAVAVDEPINFLQYRMELFEMADELLYKERMKEFLAKGKPKKWEHFSYWADYEISKLIDWHGKEWMAEKADLLLRGDNGIHWRDRQRFRNKWGV
jgi:hypothetical protein